MAHANTEHRHFTDELTQGLDRIGHIRGVPRAVADENAVRLGREDLRRFGLRRHDRQVAVRRHEMIQHAPFNAAVNNSNSQPTFAHFISDRRCHARDLILRQRMRKRFFHIILFRGCRKHPDRCAFFTNRAGDRPGIRADQHRNLIRLEKSAQRIFAFPVARETCQF